MFVRAGYIVLTYDKRGVGKSSGVMDGVSFEELADDAVAGARMLQGRPDVDRGRIGFWGLSQGSWIAPLAAVRFGNAAFVLSASGGGLSPEQQELLDTEDTLRRAGFSASDIAEALVFQRTRNNYLRTGDDWVSYLALRRAARGRKWYGYGNTDAFGPLTREDPYWDRTRRFYFYDPATTLQRLACPALFVFGALDTPAGVQANVAALRSVTARFDVRVVPGAGHNLFVGESDPNEALLKSSLRYARGYPKSLVDWAVKHSSPVRNPKPS
jgi:pimeloyl-ACP methyl ester carboxylesterase